MFRFCFCFLVVFSISTVKCFAGTNYEMKLSKVSEIVSAVVLMEDFNGCNTGFPEGWITFSVKSNKDWMCSDNSRGASGLNNDYAAEMNGFGADEASEDWLITPVLNLDNRPFYLNFNSVVRYGGPPLQILYSSDYVGSGDPNSATWEHFTEAESAVDGNINSWNYLNSGNIMLPPVTGAVYIAFKYISDGITSGLGSTVRIDDVVVKSGVLYSENFNEACIDPLMAFFIEHDPSEIISCTTGGASGKSGDYAIRGNGYGVGTGTGWIISPMLDFSSADYFLSFNSKERFTGPAIRVMYSLDYSGSGDPEQANWISIPEAEAAIGSDSWSNSGEIALDFLNQPACIAFKYTSNGSGSGQSTEFTLDDIMIREAIQLLSAGKQTIPAIQGTGMESPFKDKRVITGGIVTAIFNGNEPYPAAGYQSNLNGFYIQDISGDGDIASSDGIFVVSQTTVSVGDSISFKALVKEDFGLTQLVNVDSLVIISTGNKLPESAIIDLPLLSADHFERYEGMMVEFSDVLTVTGNYNLGRYGELILAEGGIVFQATQLIDPNDDPAEGVSASGNSNVAAVSDYLQSVTGRTFILDDGRDGSNMLPVAFLNDEGTLRAGSTVTGLKGIFTYGFNAYRLQPTSKPVFTYAPRASVPSVGEVHMKIVAFNVLNYFNGNGTGGGFPTSRGASSKAGFARQTQKIVAALMALDGDVVGLIEIENDEDNGYSAIKALTDSLNAALGAEVYDFVSTGIIGRLNGTFDEIKNGFIYKKEVVSLAGDYAILNNEFDAAYMDGFSRPALAQTFQHIATGEKFTAVINHLKSKSSDCNSLGDPDDNDGQGNCNITRTSAAGTLASWLETDPTNSGDQDFLILGDLNAYAQEDPIDTLRSRGYTMLTDPSDFSYIFNGQYGSLDHALANASLLPQVTAVKTWHINAEEPSFLSYDGIAAYFQPSPFYSSDHDPVIVGLNFTITGSKEAIKPGQLKIYPNPAKGALNFNQAVSGKIINELGSTIVEFEEAEGLDLEGFENGMYFLIQENGSTYKIILQ